jgi:copper chaperone CopZ
MKTLLPLLVCLFCLSAAAPAQEPKPVQATFKAAGNCGQCKTRIEKALTIEGVTGVSWNKRTQKVTVEFLSPPLTADSLQRRVAAAGHDTEKFRATDSTYSRLPNCCLYRDSRNRH